MDNIENDDYASQLRSLRLILAENFRPISTENLAALAHIAPVSIRGVEAGRRQLNDEDRRNIEIYVGARWDEKSHEWVCASNPDVPFDRVEYLVYSANLESGRALTRSNQGPFSKALEILLDALPAKEANATMLKLHHELLAIAKQNNIEPGLIEEIERCRPFINPQEPRPVKNRTETKRKTKS